MRKWFVGPAILALLGFAASPLTASTLGEKQQETSFSASYVDTEDVAKTMQVDGQWQWIFGKGYHEVGGVLSYLDVNPDSGPSNDAIILGPVYTFNWFPDNEKITGFVEGSFGFVNGDLGDIFDDVWEASIGAKLFVGDSAAVRFDYFFQSFQGADSFDNQDSNGLRIGISIFAGNK